MRILAAADSVAFAELLELCRAREAKSRFAANGTFIRQRRGARDYWYYRGYERPANGDAGRSTLVYVGVVGDAEIETLVAAHVARNATYKTRRALAARLRRSGLPTPQPIEGAILQVLADAGLYAAGSTLVGTAAFQTYGGLLGVMLQSYRTQDIDLAQTGGLRVGGRVAPSDLLADLKAVDASFAPFFHATSPRLAAGVRNASGFGVEFLTPLRRASSQALAEVAGVPGLGAQRLRFLEYLIAGPVTSVVLHDAGIAVQVPQPMRFAVHKIMLTALRSGTSPKSAKDAAQAALLVEAAKAARLGIELGTAWLDAWQRGPSWRKTLRAGGLKLDASTLHILAEATREAAILAGESCPFGDGDDPRRALLASTRV
ncbi:MAG: hypothetical protein INR64_11710 [Caulobacteraceae bacterium]|nr:hypothetical protein [Caulobacter sp.]